MNGKNRTALIIGGCRGIGREITLRLARDGFDVVPTCRKRGAEAETLLDETGNIKPAKAKEPSPLDDPQLVKNAISVIRTDKNVSFSALRERIRREMKCASNMAGDYIHAGVRFGFLTLSDNKYTANPEDLFKDGSANDLPF